MARKRLAVGQHAQALNRTITKTASCAYWLFLPKSYARRKKPWPLILFLHGAGERGHDLELVKKHGLPKIVESKADLPFVIASPQCPEGEWWSPDLLSGLLDELLERYNVDADRVYLTGLSMGGYGTWSLATASPERFAAITPICGGGNRLLAAQLKDVPVWAFHGAKDEVVPLKESEKMVAAVTAAGGDARLTVYQHAGHDSWTETYNSPELYEWLLSHKRKAAEAHG